MEQDLLLGEHLPKVAQEQFEQHELPRGEVDGPVRDGIPAGATGEVGSPGPQVERQLPGTEHGDLRGRAVRPQPQLDDGDRGSQLVAGVIDELALRGEFLLEPVEHCVELLGQRRDVVASLDRVPAGQVLLGDLRAIPIHAVDDDERAPLVGAIGGAPRTRCQRTSPAALGNDPTSTCPATMSRTSSVRP